MARNRYIGYGDPTFCDLSDDEVTDAGPIEDDLEEGEPDQGQEEPETMILDFQPPAPTMATVPRPASIEIDDSLFTEEWLAKALANLAEHGMTVEDLMK